MIANLCFEEAKLEVISGLAKLEKSKPSVMLIGEISGILKSFEWQQMFEKEDN